MRNLTIRNSDFTPIKGKTNFSVKTNESIQRAVLSQRRQEKERSARLAALDKRLAESPGVLASLDSLKLKAKNEKHLYKKLERPKDALAEAQGRASGQSASVER